MKMTYGLIGAALVVAAMSTPASAIDLSVAAQASHFAECLKLMFTDPAEHAIKCGPGHTVFVNGTTGYHTFPKCHETEPVDTGL